ncbi:MAG: hypothetical protein CML05_11715 [Pseudozobellia sp.]|nr:hypothetical protein [Pseudozobellia sp.]
MTKKKDDSQEPKLEIDLSKYSKHALEFIYKEAVEQLSQSFTSFRAIADRSYVAIGIYFSIISYCATQLIDEAYAKSDLFYYLLTISMFISSGLIFKNLLPSKMTMPGCKPRKLIHPYYEKKDVEQIELYYKQRIVDLNQGIENNASVVTTFSRRSIQSITTAIISVAVVLFIYLVYNWIV